MAAEEAAEGGGAGRDGGGEKGDPCGSAGGVGLWVSLAEEGL